MRKASFAAILVLITLLFIVLPGFAAEGGLPASIDSPVFLNGEPEYLTTCDTNFSNILSTAAKNATGSHIALIAAGQINSSLQAGHISIKQAEAAIDDDSLIVTTMSIRELRELLNEQLMLGSEGFPHFAGMELLAEKYLDPDGHTAAEAVRILVDGEALSDSEVLSVAVTSSLYAGEYGYSFISSATSTDYTLVSAFMKYMDQTDSETVSSVGEESRSVIASETIDTDDVLTKLSLNIPSPVHIELNDPATVPDTVFYALKGQDRDLICTVLGGELPYSFTFNGVNINIPQSVSLFANITQTLPRGKRAASSADSEAVFADLANNNSVPNGSVLSIRIGSIYPPETVLYLYYYDTIGDIASVLERNENLIVDSNGNVSFQAAAGTTYFLNSRPLNESSFLDTPTPEKPFTAGIILILILFSAWVAVFFIRRRRKRPAGHKPG